MATSLENRKFWMVAKATEAEIFLYDQIGESFWGDGTSAKQFADQFKAISKVPRIVLHINSPGGSVFDASAIYDLIKQSDIPVDVQVDGVAASAAFTVAMAGRNISIGEAGLMMLHNARGMVGGTAKDMKATAEILDKISNQMAEIYAKRCGKPVADVLALMDKETWLTPQECVDIGFANEIYASPIEEDVAATMCSRLDLSPFRNVPETLKLRIAALATPKISDGGILQKNPTATAGKEIVMAETQTATATAAVEVKEDAGKLERERCSAINQLGAQYHKDVQGFIDNETPLADVKIAIADMAIADARANSREGGLAHPTISSLTEKERKSYSIVRALASMIPESNVDASFERSVSDAMAKDLQMTPRGLFIPTNLNPQMSGLDTKTNAAGKYTVATEVRELIELLRNRAKVMQLGAEVLTGLTSTVTFPRELTATAASWVTENPGSDVADSDGTFGILSLSPKTLQGTTSFSKQLLQQSSIDIENHVRSRLAISHALAIDLAALDGTGTTQPTGLLRTANIGSVVIAASAGGAPTYAKILECETNLATANADEAGMRWLTTPTMRGKLKQLFTNTTYGEIPIWTQAGNSPGVGDMIGYPAYVSQQVPATKTSGVNSDCHCIILGYWPSLMIAEFGVMDLILDPYAKKKQGMLEVTSFQMIDIGVRQPANFAAIQDARNV